MTTGASQVEFSLWELMYVGSHLAMLRSATARTIITPTRGRARSIPDQLRMLQEDLASLELTQSEAILLDGLEKLVDCLEDPERPSRQLGRDVVCLRNLVRGVEATLQLEASSRKTFVVQRSREGEVERLLQDPAAFLGIPAGGLLELTQQGDDDLRETARCYAVGFTAASMMFMLRAIEDVLRGFHRQVTKKSVGESWYKMTQELKTKGCSSQLVGQLDILRKKRNEAMHPKERLLGESDEEAAKKTLNECRHVVTLMVDDLKKRYDADVGNEDAV